MADEPRLSHRNRQRQAALEKANAARAERKRIRNMVKSGKLDGIKLIEGHYADHEDTILRWRLDQIVPLIPGIGAVSAQEIWEVGRFSPRMKLSALSPQRRKELAGLCAEAS